MRQTDKHLKRWKKTNGRRIKKRLTRIYEKKREELQDSLKKLYG